jgi:hypothetical protein
MQSDNRREKTMSLRIGVPIKVIEAHLAVLFVTIIQPTRGKHAFERVLEAGYIIAKNLLRGWYAMYGGTNTDDCEAGAFDGADVAKLEEQVIEAANRTKEKVLAEANLPG